MRILYCGRADGYPIPPDAEWPCVTHGRAVTRLLVVHVHESPRGRGWACTAAHLKPARIRVAARHVQRHCPIDRLLTLRLSSELYSGAKLTLVQLATAPALVISINIRIRIAGKCRGTAASSKTRHTKQHTYSLKYDGVIPIRVQHTGGGYENDSEICERKNSNEKSKTDFSCNLYQRAMMPS